MFSSTLSAADDDRVEALEGEVAELKARIRQLEAQLSRILSIKEDQVVIAEVDSTATDLPEPQPVVEIGGRIKADIILNDPSAGGPGGVNRANTAFSPGSIPLSSIGEENQTSLSARDSRFWIKARTPTDLGELGAYVELDFVSFDGSGNERVSNSYNPRLRHAYGTFRNVSAGQTYTTFLNTQAYPELNDSNGPVGIHNVRQPLIRYQDEIAWGRWTISVEQPETTLTTSSGSRLTPDDDRFPDLVGRLDFDGLWGNWSIAGLVRMLRADQAIASGNSDSQWAGAVSASGRIYIGSVDNVRFALTMGRGTGRYLSFNAFNGATISNAGIIETINTTSGFIAYQHWWNERLRSNLAIGYADADTNLAMTPASVNDSFWSTHLNVIWSPVPTATLGLEWLAAKRTLANGQHGRLNRIQVTSLYKF
jgi:hypothetical protein